ncbi:MAG: hypothetical protein ABWY13_09300 [Mesorhizobium sp.]|jgi:hypothetical protein
MNLVRLLRNNMTYRIGGHVFFGSLPGPWLVAVGTAIVLLSGCASSAVNNTAPASATGPVNTGTFPNLNIPPSQAAEQLTPAQTQAEVAALRSAQQQHAASATVPSGQTDPEQLRKLATTHAEDALKQIEQ